MTELHNDGQDKAQRAAMRGTTMQTEHVSRYIRTSPEDEVSAACTIFRKRLQECRDRAYAQGREGIFEAIDNLISGLDDPQAEFDIEVKHAHEAEGSDFTTSDIAREQTSAGWRQR